MVEWWKGAAATISGVATFCWSVHYWNEGYRQRAETHPITAWLEQRISREEDDRSRRIEALEREAVRAERRLTAIHRWLPHLQSRSHEISLDTRPSLDSSLSSGEQADRTPSLLSPSS